MLRPLDIARSSQANRDVRRRGRRFGAIFHGTVARAHGTKCAEEVDSTMARLQLAAVSIILVAVWNSPAVAADIIAGPVPIHPDDGYTYTPLAAEFVSDSVLVVAYSRGERVPPNNDLVGLGNFVRVYDAATGTFGDPIPLVPDETRTTVGIAFAVNGDHRRVTFTEENGIVLPECSEACGRDPSCKRSRRRGSPPARPCR